MKKSLKNNSHFEKVARSFDISADYHIKDLNEYETVPAEILSDEELELLYDIRIDSGLKEFKKFINPEKGKKLLDIGCYLNLIFYKYHRWPSVYYGIDISENVIKSLEAFVKKNKLSIGALHCASVDNIPYDSEYFDYVTCINVFEYFSKSYAKTALNEISRVLKSGGKFIVDIPNPKHICFPIMLKVEKYFNRDNKFLDGELVFEEMILSKYDIIEKDTNSLMVKYYLIRK